MKAPPDPDYAGRVRRSFAKQAFMHTLGASLARVEPGAVDIVLSRRDALTQQHGFLHAGVLATVADSACGYAALTLMPPGTGVLSIEFKINLLAPAQGERFLATGRVARAGRNITVCTGAVYAGDAPTDTPVAIMQATMMTVQGRPELAD